MKTSHIFLAIYITVVICVVIAVVAIAINAPRNDTEMKNPYLTNEQVIKETKHCEQNGLRAVESLSWGTHKIYEITCFPKN